MVVNTEQEMQKAEFWTLGAVASRGGGDKQKEQSANETEVVEEQKEHPGKPCEERISTVLSEA